MLVQVWTHSIVRVVPRPSEIRDLGNTRHPMYVSRLAGMSSSIHPDVLLSWHSSSRFTITHIHDMPVKRVAVIGAGPAGAITVDALAQEQAFDVIRVFERRKAPGGCW